MPGTRHTRGLFSDRIYPLLILLLLLPSPFYALATNVLFSLSEMIVITSLFRPPHGSRKEKNPLFLGGKGAIFFNFLKTIMNTLVRTYVRALFVGRQSLKTCYKRTAIRVCCKKKQEPKPVQNSGILTGGSMICKTLKF